MRPALVPFVCLLLACLSAPAAAINCGAARSPHEREVCKNKQLLKLDEDLDKTYNSALSQLTPASAGGVKSDQRAWLAWVDRICPTGNAAVQLDTCLADAYKQRSLELRRVNGKLLYPRAHFVYTAGKLPAPGSEDAHFDPGFGYGQFAWPQIDAPSPDEAAFNSAVAEAAVPAETTLSDHKASTFEAATSPHETLFGSFSSFAFNDHFIVVDLFSEVYLWGGAHPGTQRSSFIWSSDQRKRVTVGDILRPDSDWQHKLLEPAIAKLHAAHVNGDLWQGKELTDGVSSALANPAQWDLSRGGLTLTFAQYEVTCYACGTPEITFTWDDLKPYLRPGFDPARLPERIASQRP